ncbi:hypothetical protein FB451DRAFT_75330 [Mycena latifolia]|nr:hypothetical protein FB451DRAFT_75330 [Mycena latifolia]
MPALRTRTTHSPLRSLGVTTSAPQPALEIIAPTPRAFTFPTKHNLAYSSPANSPFEPDVGTRALSAGLSAESHHNEELLFPHDLDDRRQFQQEFQEDVKLGQALLPLSAFTRTLSPAAFSPSGAPASTSTFSAPPTSSTEPVFISSPAAQVIRKSNSASPNPRRPKRGDDDYVKRPENAFILFRRRCCEERALSNSLSAPPTPSGSPSPSLSAPPSLATADAPSSGVGVGAASGKKKERQADLSKLISAQWKALSPAERAHWEALARERKREHEARYPGYVYRPRRAEKRSTPAASSSGASTSSGSGSGAVGKETNSERVEFIVPAPRQQRSASAPGPTPQPHQAVQVPDVYLPASTSFASPSSSSTFPGALAPSDASAEPSLMQMISSCGGTGGFDYTPTFAGEFAFEAGLQSSDFLRAMFPPSSASTASISPLSATAAPGSVGSGMVSPASSTSGSGTGSPYTPSAAFHPSMFSSSFSFPFSPSPAPGAGADFSTYAAPGDDVDIGLGLSLDSSSLGLQLHDSAGQAEYTPYASAWDASSPWAALDAGMGIGAGLETGDFDIAGISEIGWELGGGCAFPGATPDAYLELPLGAGDLALGAEGGFDVGGEVEMGMDFGGG